MRKLTLYMTMTVDGYSSGPNGELDWMANASDHELNDDTIALLNEYAERNG